MKYRPYVLFALLSGYQIALCQEQPLVTFPAGKNIRDPTPYKLVFDEEFDADAIDYSKWRTWNSYAGGSEDDDWEDARWDPQGGHAIIRDENVVVGNGVCTLQIKHGPEYWHCPSCTTTHYANYSTGWLTTRYSQYYNNGRFEARIKFPRSDYTWSTMWTYYGNPPGINEIDIAEAHGGPFFPAGPFGKNNHFKVSYSLHAQPPPLGYPNPYGLQDDEVANLYPNQSWWDKVHGRYFDLDNWHTYTCEWDTALITTYLDGVKVNEVTKYYYYDCIPTFINPLPFVLIETGCRDVAMFCYGGTIPGKQYHTLRGFPYYNESRSHLRFTTQMFEDETPYNSWTHTWDTSRYLKGEMAIDYVRIWQRHPEQDGHTDLCNNPLPNITGPDIVCSTATYTAGSGASGTWSVGGLNIVSQTSNSITVQKPSASSGAGYIRFHYQPATCPLHSVTKSVDVGPPGPFVVTNIVRARIPMFPYCFYTLMVQHYGLNGFLFRPMGPYSPTTYKWDINYGQNYYNHLTGNGQFLVTPLAHYSSSEYGGISGSVTISNGCGNKTLYFSKANSQAKIAKVQGDDSTVADTPVEKISWFEASITDTVAYKEAVEARINQIFLPDTVENDTLAFEQAIYEIMADELEPYLLLDSSQMENYKTYPISSHGNAQSAEVSRVFPNPTTGLVNISLGSGFDDRLPIEICTTDMYGHTSPSVSLPFVGGAQVAFDISSLAGGIYTLTLRQGTHIERLRILKQ